MAYTTLTKYSGGDYFPSSQWNLGVDNFEDHEGRITQNESDISSSIALVGEIKTYAGSSAPAGHFECDGSAISRTTYADLFTALGESWGEGDGSTTFNIPDLRGRFLRGYDNGAGVDPDAGSRTAIKTGGATGDNIGSAQEDAFQGHWHELYFDTNSGASGANTTINNPISLSSNRVRNPISDGVNGAPRTTSETRPLNASVMYIIKY